MDLKQLQMELVKLKQENENLKAREKAKIKARFSEKSGALCLVGIRKWPLTFYKSEWETILASKEIIEQGLQEHASVLSTGKDDPRYQK